MHVRIHAPGRRIRVVDQVAGDHLLSELVNSRLSCCDAIEIGCDVSGMLVQRRTACQDRCASRAVLPLEEIKAGQCRYTKAGQEAHCSSSEWTLISISAPLVPARSAARRQAVHGCSWPNIMCAVELAPCITEYITIGILGIMSVQHSTTPLSG